MSKKILFSLGGGLSGVKYGASLSLTIDDEYVISAQLLDQNGDPLGKAQIIDLPLESVVVDGSYDAENKALVLTLDNGNTISIPVADLINGLQAEITPDNKLSADLVDDSSTDNKFVTQEEKNQIAKSAELNLENGTGGGSIKLEGNKVSGLKSTGLGHNNTVQADRAFASGGGNVIRYDGQTQNGYMGFASGQNNYVSGWSASAIGEQLEAKYGGQLVVGKANLNKPDTLFEVGNGETLFINVSSKPSWQDIISNPIYYISNGSGGFTKITENNITEAQYDNLLISEIYVFYDGGRSNVFEVTGAGIARAYGTPVGNNDLIPKGYADVHYGQSIKTITVALSQIAGAGNDVYTTAQFIRFTPTQEQAAILANNDYSIIKLDLTALGNSAPAPYVWLRRNTVIELPNPLDPSSKIPAYQFTCGGEQFWYENYQTDIAIKNIGNAALVFSPDLGTADITLLNISIPTLYETLGKIPTNIGNGTINGTLTQKNLSYNQMIEDFEPNMAAYVYVKAGNIVPANAQAYLAALQSSISPTSAQLIDALTNQMPSLQIIITNYKDFTGTPYESYNAYSLDGLIKAQLSDRWGVSSSDNLENSFGRASDGAVGLGFKNKLYSPAAVTLGFDNQAGDEGYPSESIAAVAIGYRVKSLGNQTSIIGKQSVFKVSDYSGEELEAAKKYRQNRLQAKSYLQSIGSDAVSLFPENASTDILYSGTAKGENSHVLGGSIAIGKSAVALNDNNIAIGDNSQVAGNQNIVLAPDGFTTGLQNYVYQGAMAAITVGGFNINTGRSSFVVGESNLNRGVGSIVSGYQCQENGSDAIMQGLGLFGGKDYSAIFGKYNKVNRIVSYKTTYQTELPGSCVLFEVPTGTHYLGSIDVTLRVTFKTLPDKGGFNVVGSANPLNVPAYLTWSNSFVDNVFTPANFQVKLQGINYTWLGLSTRNKNNVTYEISKVEVNINNEGWQEIDLQNPMSYQSAVSVETFVDYLFAIGNGTADNARHNAFEVTDTGVARAYGTPEDSYDLTPKSYIDAALQSKLDKPANPPRGSCVTLGGDGTVGTTPYVYEGATAWSIPLRDASGKIKTAAPVDSNDATNKTYVDTSINNAIANVYKLQGTATVDTLNNLTKSININGYVYDLSTAGNLTQEDSTELPVAIGDNVVFLWNDGNWKWDKLAANLDLSGYVQKSTTIAGVDLQDNITANELKNALNVSSTLSGSSVPTTATVGALGQVYIDTANKIPYMCVEINNGTYTWVAIAAVSLDYSSTN